MATGTALSNYLEDAMLDHILGDTAFTAPATVYVALFTAAPTDAGGGTEASGGSYARVAVTNNTTNFPNSSGGSKSNGTAVTFPSATANWGTVLAVGVFDAATAGNLLFWAIITNRAVNSGDQAVFAATALTFALD